MRQSLSVVALFAAVIAFVPSEKDSNVQAEVPAYQSPDSILPTMAAPVVESDPLVEATACENGFCRRVMVPASQVCDRCGQVHANPFKGSAATTERSIVTKTVSYSAPVTRTVYYGSGHRTVGSSYSFRNSGRVFNADAPYFQRGPARRIMSAPFRWIFRNRGC
jgi:hypothetical protein